MFVDSHCHINFEGLADRLPDVLDKMREHAVTHALCVSVDLETLPSVLAIAEQHENVYASVGVHPDHEDMREPSVAELVELGVHCAYAVGMGRLAATSVSSSRVPVTTSAKALADHGASSQAKLKAWCISSART